MAQPEGAIPIAVTNISKHGFAAITDRQIANDATIVFEAAGVTRKARIVWRKEVTLGADFITPLSDEDLSAILSGSASTI